MKFSTFPLGGLALAPLASAHYMFGHFIFEGRWTDDWEYVRKVTPRKDTTPELELVFPNTEPTSTDLRCGRGATTAWSRPKTATVHAGDYIGFGASWPWISGGEFPSMYHPGFASAWISKAPDGDLDSYLGDGDWVKILSVTKRTEQSVDLTSDYWKKFVDSMKAPWGTYLSQSWNFTIPESTPPGKYLVRFEHIFPNLYDAQYYPNCAHVEIINDSDNIGTPGPTVKIPGVYTRGQPDVYFSTYDYLLSHDMSVDDFVPPKPEVWRG
jgi:hypothetical protein